MKKRSLNYENKFRKYLFNFDFETHKKICQQINVKPNVEENLLKYQKAFNLLMEYWDSLPDEEKPEIDKRLKKIGL